MAEYISPSEIEDDGKYGIKVIANRVTAAGFIRLSGKELKALIEILNQKNDLA